MSTELYICNVAIIDCGEVPVGSLNEPHKAAKLCKYLISDTIKELAEDYPWSFSTSRAKLSPEASDPQFGYAKQFVLPGNYSRLWWIGASGNRIDDYAVESDRILTNYDSIEIIYTVNDFEIAESTAMWRSACGALLATKIALPLTDDSSVLESARVKFRDRKAAARMADRSNKSLTLIQEDTLLSSRYNRGFVRDPGTG